MRRSIGTAFTAAMVVGLAGCGGGGGGGGGGVPLLPIAVAPAPAPAPAPQTPAAPELKLAVEIGGSAASPDGSGNYVVVPGQLVVVKASDSAAWLGSSQSTGTTRTDVDTTTTQWASRFANSSKSAAGSYKLVANASENRSKELNFTVKTGTYGNGEYMVFAGNGSRQKLSLDLDNATYSLTDAAGDTTSGTMTPLTTPPDANWQIQSSRMTVTNASSLWISGDSIVGGFPFAKPFSAPVSYAESAFFATRALVLTQSKLDGTYDRARIEVSASGGESAIAQIQISGGGTVMKQCVDQIIYRIELCPTAKLVTSKVEADTEAGMWRLKDPTDGTLLGKFAIANVEGDKIYLSAGTSPANGNQVLAIGVPAAADFNAFSSQAWSTSGTLDMVIVSPAGYQLANPISTLTLSSLGSSSPLGMRAAESGADLYFAMRSKRLELLIGGRSPSPKAGFLHMGFVYREN